MVVHLVAQAAEPLFETGGTHRGRAHVDPTSPLPEVERGADDRDLALLVGHVAEPICIETGLH